MLWPSRLGQSAAWRTTGIESDAVESAGGQEFQVSASCSISLLWETCVSPPLMDVSTGLCPQSLREHAAVRGHQGALENFCTKITGQRFRDWDPLPRPPPYPQASGNGGTDLGGGGLVSFLPPSTG